MTDIITVFIAIYSETKDRQLPKPILFRIFVG